MLSVNQNLWQYNRRNWKLDLIEKTQERPNMSPLPRIEPDWTCLTDEIEYRIGFYLIYELLFSREKDLT